MKNRKKTVLLVIDILDLKVKPNLKFCMKTLYRAAKWDT